MTNGGWGKETADLSVERCRRKAEAAREKIDLSDERKKRKEDADLRGTG